MTFIYGASANTIGGAASGAANVISGNNQGVYIGSGTSGNVVLGNLIGTDIHGTAKLGNANAGVDLVGATANTIGGAASGAANVVSGNKYGVYFANTGTSGNVVLGNFIGTDVHGTAVLGNTTDGVLINLAATDNTVGGAGAGNVVSGNFNGIEMAGFGTSGNVVLGNLIGTDVHGTASLGNGGGDGVALIFGESANTVGGVASGAGNVISGNNQGVYFTGTSGNVVLGNLIGTDIHGTAKLGNTSGGIDLYGGATANTIGGAAAGAGNVISGNFDGVDITNGGTANVVLGNFIGADVHGTANLGNSRYGVYVDGVQNSIGGTAASSGNTIAFNAEGVVLSGSSAVRDSILGNSIFSNTGPGIDLGSPAGNNGQAAPVLTSVTSTTSTVVLGTLTSAPGTYRVEFFASPSSGPAGQGKTYLGLSSFTVPSGGTMSFIGYGLAALPPNSVVTATATNTTTGSTYGDTSAFSAGLKPFSGLVVTDTSDSASDTGSLRYQLNHLAAGSNTITFDIPGTGAKTIDLTSPLPVIKQKVDIKGLSQGGNGYSGPPLIVLDGVGAGSGAIGLDFAAGSSGSVVRGLDIQQFSGDGIVIKGGASGILVAGNFIGTGVSGATRLGNLTGILLENGASANTIGGTAGGDANVISGNGEGVDLSGNGTSGNLVTGNKIGTDKTGALNLGNNGDAVSLSGGASNNTIGGTASGTGNFIAFNAAGVVLTGATPVGASILGTSMYSNTSGGIDLGSGNHGQTAPANSSVAATSYTGTLTSANGTYRVEVFATPASGPDLPQGKTFLGAMNVVITTGSKSFTIGGLSIPANSTVTATATNLGTHDTSAFATAATAGFGTTTAFTSAPVFAVSGQAQTIKLSAHVSSSRTVNVGTVTFTIVGIGTVTATVGANGVATANFVVPANTAAGQYQIIAAYNGAGGFASSSTDSEDDSDLTVKPAKK